VAVISVSFALGQTPVYIVRPRRLGYCIACCACFSCLCCSIYW